MRARFTVVTTPTQIRQMARGALMPVITRAAHAAAADWQKSIPHKWPGQDGHITGNTARSITVRQPNQHSVSIGTNTISGVALETGAATHLIRPRRYRHGWILLPGNLPKKTRSPGVRALIWPESRGGFGPPGPRVRLIANHPGVGARYYGHHALERQRVTLQTNLRLALLRIP